MAQITPPTPLKPIWPVRREPHPDGRRREPDERDRNRPDNDRTDHGDEDHHAIDEFV